MADEALYVDPDASREAVPAGPDDVDDAAATVDRIERHNEAADDQMGMDLRDHGGEHGADRRAGAPGRPSGAGTRPWRSGDPHH